MSTPLIHLNKAALRELTAAHYTQSEIATILECSYHTVSARMRDYGIAPLKAVARDKTGERNPRWSAGWSLQYDRCKHCGTTTNKHAAHGLCGSCYSGQRMPGATPELPGTTV